MSELIYSNESYLIVNCAMEVFNRLGPGFSEKVYQDALEVELKHREIPYEREKHLKICYREVELEHDFFVDFVCYDKIILELKAVETIAPAHKAQLLNYLKAANLQLGIVLNFGSSSLQYNRVVNFYQQPS